MICKMGNGYIIQIIDAYLPALHSELRPKPDDYGRYGNKQSMCHMHVASHLHLYLAEMVLDGPHHHRCVQMYDRTKLTLS